MLSSSMVLQCHQGKIKLLKMVYRTLSGLVSVSSPSCSGSTYTNDLPLSFTSSICGYCCLAGLQVCQWLSPQEVFIWYSFCLEDSFTLESIRACSLHGFQHFIQMFPHRSFFDFLMKTCKLRLPTTADLIPQLPCFSALRPSPPVTLCSACMSFLFLWFTRT